MHHYRDRIRSLSFRMAGLCAAGLLALAAGPSLARAESGHGAQVNADAHAGGNQVDASADFNTHGNPDPGSHGGWKHADAGAPAPEPAGWLLMGTVVLAGAAFVLRDRRRQEA